MHFIIKFVILTLILIVYGYDSGIIIMMKKYFLFLSLLITVVYAKKLVFKVTHIRVTKQYYSNDRLKSKELYINSKLVRVKKYSKKPVIVFAESFGDDVEKETKKKCFLVSDTKYKSNKKNRVDRLYNGCEVYEIDTYKNNKLISSKIIKPNEVKTSVTDAIKSF